MTSAEAATFWQSTHGTVLLGLIGDSRPSAHDAASSSVASRITIMWLWNFFSWQKASVAICFDLRLFPRSARLLRYYYKVKLFHLSFLGCHFSTRSSDIRRSSARAKNQGFSPLALCQIKSEMWEHVAGINQQWRVRIHVSSAPQSHGASQKQEICAI